MITAQYLLIELHTWTLATAIGTDRKSPPPWMYRMPPVATIPKKT